MMKSICFNKYLLYTMYLKRTNLNQISLLKILSLLLTLQLHKIINLFSLTTITHRRDSYMQIGFWFISGSWLTQSNKGHLLAVLAVILRQLSRTVGFWILSLKKVRLPFTPPLLPPYIRRKLSIKFKSFWCRSRMVNKVAWESNLLHMSALMYSVRKN